MSSRQSGKTTRLMYQIQQDLDFNRIDLAVLVLRDDVINKQFKKQFAAIFNREKGKIILAFSLQEVKAIWKDRQANRLRLYVDDADTIKWINNTNTKVKLFNNAYFTATGRWLYPATWDNFPSSTPGVNKVETTYTQTQA